MKPWAESFYKGTAWQSCREAYAASVNHLCEDCLAKGLITPGEIVHHKTWINIHNINDPNITLNFKNLKLVCRECHAAEHKAKDERRYYFDSQGNCVIKELKK